MIDEKKITEAQDAFFEEKVYGKGEDITYNDLEGNFVCREERYNEGHVKDAFKAGAKWAQQEFIKSLWHDASEEPRIGRLLIGHDVDGYSLYSWLHQEDTWREFVGNCGLIRWAYLDDILPKEGGE